MVGLLGVCELVPLLFMAFVGGALADYLDRRRLVIVGELALAALTGVLLVNALLGRPQLWLLFVVAALAAASTASSARRWTRWSPGWSSPSRSRPRARSTRCACRSPRWPARPWPVCCSRRSTWPGSTRSTWPPSRSGWPASPWSARSRRRPPPTARRSARWSTGLRYAASRPELLGTYLVDINAMFFGMPQALYPFVAARLGGPAVLGLLYAAPSVGSLLATLTSGWTARVHRHGLRSCSPPRAWGAGDRRLRAVANTLWLPCSAWPLAGAADMISGIFRTIIWNQTIPDHLRGRLAGIEMLSYTIRPDPGQPRVGADGPARRASAARSSGAASSAWSAPSPWPPHCRSSSGTTGSTAWPASVADDSAWAAPGRRRDRPRLTAPPLV